MARQKSDESSVFPRLPQGRESLVFSFKPNDHALPCKSAHSNKTFPVLPFAWNLWLSEPSIRQRWAYSQCWDTLCLLHASSVLQSFSESGSLSLFFLDHHYFPFLFAPSLILLCHLPCPLPYLGKNTCTNTKLEQFSNQKMLFLGWFIIFNSLLHNLYNTPTLACFAGLLIIYYPVPAMCSPCKRCSTYT